MFSERHSIVIIYQPYKLPPISVMSTVAHSTAHDSVNHLLILILILKLKIKVVAILLQLRHSLLLQLASPLIVSIKWKAQFRTLAAGTPAPAIGVRRAASPTPPPMPLRRSTPPSWSQNPAGTPWRLPLDQLLRYSLVASLHRRLVTRRASWNLRSSKLHPQALSFFSVCTVGKYGDSVCVVGGECLRASLCAFDLKFESDFLVLILCI